MNPKYTHLFSEPPKEIIERNRTGITEFTKVLRDLSRSDSLVREQNRVDYLANDMFASHPSIHRGYHDEIDSGVILVKDFTTDKLIRKDNAILTSDGRFLLKTSNFIVHSLADVNVDFRRKVIKALNGDVDVLNDMKKFIFFDRKSNSYIPFNKKYFVKTITPSKYGQIIHKLFRDYYAENNILYIPHTVANFNVESFTLYLKTNLVDLVNKYCEPKIHTSLVDYVRAGVLKIENNVYLRDTNMRSDTPLRPGIYLNADSTCIKWDTSRVVGYQSVLTTSSDDFWFDFILNTEMAAQLTKCRKTRNNDGMLLSYTNKVENYKVPFKMLPEEQNLFDFYEKEAMKKRNGKKHPDHNPIYLGLEIEAIVRNPYATREGYVSVLKEIADSKFGDHMIMKSDTSMHSQFGIEFVTIPASLAYHKKMFEDNFFSKETAFHKKIMSNENCGIHVHISKNVLTELKWGQYINFVNAPENSTFIDAMANRTQNGYCVRQPMVGKNVHGVNLSAKIIARACRDGLVKGKLDTATRPYRNSTRRVSVNWDNGATIELRCFKSSNDKNNILRKLEFCESLVRFVRNHSTQQMTVYDYINFILEGANKKEYPYIVRWLASKNYIDHTRKKIQGKNKLAHVYGTNKVPVPDTIYHKQKETK